MSQIKINATQAIRLLEEVVAEAPDGYIYPMIEDSRACHYQYQGAPSCGVGQALFKAGVTVDQLKEMDGLPEDTSIWVLWTKGSLPEGLELTEGARSVFDQFQTSQDKRLGPWSESLDHAKMCYALHATNPQER